MKRRRSPFFTQLCLVPLLVICMAPMFATGCASREEVAAQRASISAEKDKLDTAGLAGKAMLDQLAQSFATLKSQADQLQATSNDSHVSAELRAQAQAAYVAVATQLAAIQKSSADATSAIDAAHTKSAELAARLAAADAALAKADAPSNPGSSIGAFLTLLYPGLGVAAAPLLGLGYKQVQLVRTKNILAGVVDQKSNAITNIVTSIDALGTIVPEVAAAIEKHAPLLDAIQKQVGKNAVDQVQQAKVAA